jgi:cobalt/nickel transport system ATP-binding protein
VILISKGSIIADGPAEKILADKELLESNHLELPLRLQ